MILSNPKLSGWYWVLWSWSTNPQPGYWDGDSWLRPGIECPWNDDVISIGPPIIYDPEQYRWIPSLG